MSFLKNEPALTGAIASLFAAVLGLFIHNPELVAALVGVAGVFFGVRQVVTPVATAAENITTAATDTASKVVQSLDQTTVGITGQITDTAQSVIDHTVDEVVGGLLKK